MAPQAFAACERGRKESHYASKAPKFEYQRQWLDYVKASDVGPSDDCFVQVIDENPWAALSRPSPTMQPIIEEVTEADDDTKHPVWV